MKQYISKLLMAVVAVWGLASCPMPKEPICSPMP